MLPVSAVSVSEGMYSEKSTHRAPRLRSMQRQDVDHLILRWRSSRASVLLAAVMQAEIVTRLAKKRRFSLTLFVFNAGAIHDSLACPVPRLSVEQ